MQVTTLSNPVGFVEIPPSNTQCPLTIRTDVAVVQPRYRAWQKNSTPKASPSSARSTSSRHKKKLQEQQAQEPIYLPLYDISFLQQPNVYHDLSQLPSPDIGALLYILSYRYGNDQIYTALGNSVLVSVNPYKQIEALYSEELHQKIRSGRSEMVSNGAIPHIFSIAELAYSNLLSTKRNQAILISGESGSGKTEATKRCLRYLVAESGSNSNIERRLLSANPVLESFGNARTSRNHNSSRFGKWVEIRFGSNNLISGCVTTSYLLEKSRVVAFDQGESNYHVLHVLAKYCYPDVRQRHQVALHHRCRILHANHMKHTHGYNEDPSLDTYRPPVLRTGRQIEGQLPAEEEEDECVHFRNICQAMDMLDFSDREIDMLWRVLSIVLHLGNLVCVESTEENNTTTIEEYQQGRVLRGARAMVSNQWSGPSSMQVAASLMGISAMDLHRTLLFKSFTAARGRASITSIPLSLIGK